MAKGTRFVMNPGFAESLLRSAPVEALVDGIAADVLANAKSGAPVDTGAYKDDLHIEHHDSQFRRTARVVGSDPKTMLIESKTGNLARSLRAAKQ